MNAGERRRGRQALAMLRAGDRAGALAILAALFSHPWQPPESGDQLAFSFVASFTFRCERLGIDRLPIRDCLERRGAVWPSGRRRGVPKSPQCAACPIGQSLARAVPYRVRPPSQPPEVLPAAQRLAKMIHGLCLDLGEPLEPSPMQEAAELTPDDRILP